MIRIIHFADAHIDLARQGRHDPQSGLPLRVLDFLKAFDSIIDTAISKKVDLVIFAGDAYRDRSPTPTYQREWGKRIIRLSQAGIQTLLVVGNHDISPATGRAHTLQEFETLQIPNVRVISKPCLLGPKELNGLQVQVIGIPWLNRSGMAAALIDEESHEPSNVSEAIESKLSDLIEHFKDKLDPALPAIFTGHLTVQGATYGNERSVMLGRDFILPGSMLRDPRLDYVALGHIHKFQNLNPDGNPPIIYPGSIEKIDFGEIDDRKTFILAEIERGHTEFNPIDLPGREFIDRSVTITNPDNVQEQIFKKIPAEEKIKDSIFKLVINYTRDWEALIDEPAIRRKAEGAFEFHLIRRPKIQARLRLPNDESAATLSPLELLEKYWEATGKKQTATEPLKQLAQDIIQNVNSATTLDEETLEKSK